MNNETHWFCRNNNRKLPGTQKISRVETNYSQVSGKLNFHLNTGKGFTGSVNNYPSIFWGQLITVTCCFLPFPPHHWCDYTNYTYPTSLTTLQGLIIALPDEMRFHQLHNSYESHHSKGPLLTTLITNQENK